VDGRSIMSGMHGGMQLFSGRPGTQSVDDLRDRLEAAYAKARSKDKKLTRVEFLHQLAGFLECEALRVWRKHRNNILEPRGVAEGVVWNPIPLQKSTTSHTFTQTNTQSKLLITSHALIYHTRSFPNLTIPNHLANYIHV
jgi:hypothetical protein